MRNHLIAGLLAIAGSASVTLAQSPTPPPRYHSQFIEDSGKHSGARDGEPYLAWSTSCVQDPSAPWSRIHFGEWNLGTRSFVLVISDRDLQVQRFSAQSLADWQGHSAFFNSGVVHIELWVDPADRNVFVTTKAATFGEWIGGGAPGSVESICDGTDDRTASTDSRVARWGMGGCTHWMVSNGAVLTAGHCTDFDPDGFGSDLPDGIVDFSDNIQINPPTSLADGTTRAAAVDDQYPMQPATARFRYDGEGQGLGKDWCVYRVGRNSNTNLLPHQGGGFFRMTDLVPAGGSTIRVTGFGSDTGAANFTNQTETGTYTSQQVSGNDIWHLHRVDTTGGNSGSPIIWSSNGFTIGIHTNAGCGNGSGSNSGTSFGVNALETALRNFVGTTAQFVDAASFPAGTSRNGRVFAPWATVGAGVSAVTSGGIVSIVPGTYVETGIFGTGNKAMTLDAPIGSVLIGGN